MAINVYIKNKDKVLMKYSPNLRIQLKKPQNELRKSLEREIKIKIHTTEHKIKYHIEMAKY